MSEQTDLINDLIRAATQRNAPSLRSARIAISAYIRELLTACLEKDKKILELESKVEGLSDLRDRINATIMEVDAARFWGKDIGEAVQIIVDESMKRRK